MTRNRTFLAFAVALLAGTVLFIAQPASAGAAPPDVVRTLAPSVLLYSDDAYRPAFTSEFVAGSTLRWAHDSACADDSVAPRGAVDVASLGDGGYRHSTATGFPGCHANDDSYSTTDYTRPRSGRVGGEGFFLDLDNAQRHGVGRSAPVYYEYRARQFVTYWFFFAFNDAATSVADHEGDWERISIRLDSADHPLTVAYYAHTGYCTVPWSSTPKYGAQPVAYSADGTHASYPTAGTHGLDHTDAGPRWNTAATLSDVRTQPWYGYGGAWGEVGETAESTGPLGPSAFKAPAPTDWDQPC